MVPNHISYAHIWSSIVIYIFYLNNNRWPYMGIRDRLKSQKLFCTYSNVKKEKDLLPLNQIS